MRIYKLPMNPPRLLAR